MTTKNNPKQPARRTNWPTQLTCLLAVAKHTLEMTRELFSSLLFPRRCPICDGILEPEETEKGIHSECESKIFPIVGAVCMHCGKPLGNISNKNYKKEYLELSTSREYCYDCARVFKTSQVHGNHGAQASATARHMKSHSHMPSAITQAKSLFVYKGAIKTTMYRFKYSNKREYARFFAEEAVRRYGSWLGAPVQSNAMQSHGITHQPIDIIIPVPMYAVKQRQRGYNQAECFAQELSRLTGIPVDPKAVKRIKDTTPQKGLNPEERKNNLKSAFQKQKNSVQYSHALVVDDIYTTGSTAEAVAHELIKEGVRRVYVLTICIGGDM